MDSEVKGKLIGIKIFVSDKSPKNHDCFKKVSKDEFDKFISDRPELKEDFYMDQYSFYDKDMVMLAKVERYDTDTFYIRKCFVKHRSKPVDESKGYWQSITCQTDSTLTIKTKEC